MLVADEGSTCAANNDAASDEVGMLSAACTGHIDFWPRAGHEVMTVQGVMPWQKDFKQAQCADINDFGLHAAVRCGADHCQALEQLCRCITRRRWPTNGYRATPRIR